jgi:hypothetical protein
MKSKKVVNHLVSTHNAVAELSDTDLYGAMDGNLQNIHPISAFFELRSRDALGLNKQLIATITESADDDVRAAAAIALGQDNKPAHRKALVAALTDDAPSVVRRAAEALGRIGDEKELEVLRALLPEHPLVKRAADTAKTLLSYSLGKKNGLIPVPEPQQLLSLGNDKSSLIAVEPVSIKQKKLSDVLTEHLPKWTLADQALTINCGNWHYLLVFDRETLAKISKQQLSQFKQGHLLGALLRCERADGQYYRYAHILTHATVAKRLHLFAMRDASASEVAYYGEISFSADDINFSIHALNTRHTRPIIFEGEIDTKTSKVVVTRAAVATQKAACQPVQKRPRQIKMSVG